MATNAELRAAAERVRYNYDNCNDDDVDLIADHILATVPADDAEPVTVEKLEEWDGVQSAFGPMGARHFYRDEGLPIACAPVGDGWKVCVGHDHRAWTDLVRQRNTVGEMRQTLEGLGIKLKGGA